MAIKAPLQHEKPTSPMSLDMALNLARLANIKPTGEITESMRLSALRALEHIDQIADGAPKKSDVYKYAHSLVRMEFWAGLKDAGDMWFDMVQGKRMDESLDALYNLPYKFSMLQYREIASFNQKYKGFLKSGIPFPEIVPRERYLVGNTIGTILRRASLKKNPSMFKLAKWTGVDRATLYRWKGEERAHTFRNSIERLKSLPNKPDDVPDPFPAYDLKFDIANGVVEFVGVAPGAINDPAYQPRIRAMAEKHPKFGNAIRHMSFEERNAMSYKDICALYQDFDLEEEIFRQELSDKQEEYEIKQKEEAQVQGFMPLKSYSELNTWSGSKESSDWTVRPLSLKDKSAYGVKIDVRDFEPEFKFNSTLLIDEDFKVQAKDSVIIRVENELQVGVLVGTIDDFADGTDLIEKFSIRCCRKSGKMERFDFYDDSLVSTTEYKGSPEKYQESLEDRGGQFKIIFKHKIIASRFA